MVSRRRCPAADRNAEAGPALKVVEEGLQGLVQDLIRGLGRMDGTPARPVADPFVQLLDAEPLQKAASARSSRSGESRDRAGRGEGMREADPFPGMPVASTSAPVSWQMAW